MWKEKRKVKGGYGNGFGDHMDISSSNDDDEMNKVNGAMTAPQQSPPIQPTTTQPASTNDALS